jgi:hypothetical protein
VFPDTGHLIVGLEYEQGGTPAHKLADALRRLSSGRVLVGPPPRGHAVLEGSSGPALCLRERSVRTAIAVVRRPVVFVVTIDAVDGVLSLVSGWIDERKGLIRHLRSPGMPEV